eukprot:7239044-Prymnesium_polylepis.1
MVRSHPVVRFFFCCVHYGYKRGLEAESVVVVDVHDTREALPGRLRRLPRCRILLCPGPLAGP